MTLRVNHCGEVLLEEDRYFGETVRCLEWFVSDGIRQKTDLFVIDGKEGCAAQRLPQRRTTTMKKTIAR